MGHKLDTTDSAIARIEARQPGVISIEQLEGVGSTRCAEAEPERVVADIRGALAAARR